MLLRLALFSALVATALALIDEETNRCKDMSDGVYGEGCSAQFWECIDYEEFPDECATGLFYDPLKDVCDTKESISACADQDEIPTLMVDISESTAVVATSTAAVEKTTQGVTAEDTIEIETPQDYAYADYQTEAVMEPRCETGQTGFHAKGCSSEYWSCEDGKLYSGLCPNGLFFDPVSSWCKFKKDVFICDDEAIEDEQSTAVDSTAATTTISWEIYGEKLPNCNKYGKYHGIGCSNEFMKCDRGELYKMTCSSGLYFNSVTEICDVKSSVIECIGEMYDEDDVQSTTVTASYTQHQEKESTSTVITSTTTIPTNEPTTSTPIPTNAYPSRKSTHGLHAEQSFATYLGYAIAILCILCVIYLLCGNANFSCSASINFKTNAPSDPLQKI